MTADAKAHPIVLGTAGHIDHGKTALVKALTGIDTDRLKEEKERGITTELGFAHLDLGGLRFGFVDVPGHERFIKAMVAGAGGVDLVCLVIAADEGVMPQTREHLDVCQLLGVRRGVVALTKSDLVDEEWIALVSEEIRSYLEGSFLEEAAIVPVSALTGAGLDDLRQEFTRLTRELPSRADDGVFRTPIDRSFVIKGFGTVVTGTVVAGRVEVGDAVVIHPGGGHAKVRGLQVHGAATQRARAGSRCAINLSGIAKSDVSRGSIVTHVHAVKASHLLDARFHYLATCSTVLPKRSKALLHHGTAQLMATLVLVDRDSLQPGEDALVQIRLDVEEPLAAMPGDRFIIRGFVLQDNYGTTLGGGEIIRVVAPKVRRVSQDESAAVLGEMLSATADSRVALEIKATKVAGTQAAELGRRLGRAPKHIAAALGRLVKSREVIRAGTGDSAHYCHAASFATLEKQALVALDAFHKVHPAREGMPKEELRAKLPQALPIRMFEQLIQELSERGELNASKDIVMRGQRDLEQNSRMTDLAKRLIDQFEKWGLTPPKPNAIAAELSENDKEVRAAFDRLLSRGALVRVRSDYYVGADCLEQLQQRLLQHLHEHGEITPQQWKQLTGASRKYSIPLAEYFDAAKVTLRIGDIRKKRG